MCNVCVRDILVTLLLGGTYRGLERSYNINIYWTDTREFMRRP